MSGRWGLEMMASLDEKKGHLKVRPFGCQILDKKNHLY